MFRSQSIVRNKSFNLSFRSDMPHEVAEGLSRFPN